MNQVPSSICCLFAVVDRGKGEAVSAELRRRRILTQLVLLGHGTASAEVMDLLGLDEPEKDVVLILVPAAGRQPVMKAICAEGAGIGHALAFSLPVSDVTGLSLAPFGAAEQKEEEHDEQ